jgi:hypothetical protein
MAKKKSKKSSQKQAEVATPLESIKPVAATTTEPDSTSPPEAQQEPAPTPLEPANDEPSLGGSTSLPDHNLEAAQDNPTELEPSTVAESTTKSDITLEPSELDHVDMSTAPAAPKEQTVVPMGESQSHVPNEEEHQLSTIEAEEPSHIGPSDASEITPEGVEALAEAAPEDSNTPLEGEPQPELGGEQPAEMTSSTAEEDVVINGEVLDTQTGVDAPVTADSSDDPSHPEGTETVEAEAETQQPHEYVRIPNYTLFLTDLLILDPKSPKRRLSSLLVKKLSLPQ